MFCFAAEFMEKYLAKSWKEREGSSKQYED